MRTVLAVSVESMDFIGLFAFTPASFKCSLGICETNSVNKHKELQLIEIHCIVCYDARAQWMCDCVRNIFINVEMG